MDIIRAKKMEEMKDMYPFQLTLIRAPHNSFEIKNLHNKKCYIHYSIHFSILYTASHSLLPDFIVPSIL